MRFENRFFKIFMFYFSYRSKINKKNKQKSSITLEKNPDAIIIYINDNFKETYK